MKRNILFVVLFLGSIFVYGNGQTKIDQEYRGLFFMPMNKKDLKYTTPKPKIIKDEAQFAQFIGTIPKRVVSKSRRQAPPSSDPLLKKPKINFKEKMVLVAFYGDTIYVYPKIDKITISAEKMHVNITLPDLGRTIMGARPLGMGTYCAVVVPRFDGSIDFKINKEKDTFGHNLPKIPIKKRSSVMLNKHLDFSHVIVKPAVYMADPPYVGRENPSIPIPLGTTFNIKDDQGSYSLVEFNDGTTGYLVSDKNTWAKLITVYGKVIHKPWTKSMESWQAGGSDYCILDPAGETNESFPGKFLRPTAKVSLEDITKLNGRRVKIRGIADSPKPAKKKADDNEISQRPVSQRPISQSPVGLDGESESVSQPGLGKGIKVYAIYPMKTTRNAMGDD